MAQRSAPRPRAEYRRRGHSARRRKETSCRARIIWVTEESPERSSRAEPFRPRLSDTFTKVTSSPTCRRQVAGYWLKRSEITRLEDRPGVGPFALPSCPMTTTTAKTPSPWMPIAAAEIGVQGFTQRRQTIRRIVRIYSSQRRSRPRHNANDETRMVFRIRQLVRGARRLRRDRLRLGALLVELGPEDHHSASTAEWTVVPSGPDSRHVAFYTGATSTHVENSLSRKSEQRGGASATWPRCRVAFGYQSSAHWGGPRYLLQRWILARLCTRSSRRWMHDLDLDARWPAHYF